MCSLVPRPFSGQLNSQGGRTPHGPEEAALNWGSGDGSGTYLSLTSSFTPELSWRAWFIMSYPSDRA